MTMSSAFNVLETAATEDLRVSTAQSSKALFTKVTIQGSFRHQNELVAYSRYNFQYTGIGVGGEERRAVIKEMLVL